MRTLLGLSGMLACLGVAAQDRMEQFAYSVPLEIAGEGGLHQLELPRAVYEGVSRADLADLRVFNGRGEVVPHAWRPRAAPDPAPSAWVDLPFFPLRGAAGTPVERLDVRAERSTTGTIVRVVSGSTSRTGPALLAYLVDASAFKQPIRALDLDWRNPSAGMSATLSVEASDDLRHWRPLASAAPLVDLKFGGHQLVQKQVELPSARHKYLRLTWPAGQPAIELTRVAARAGDTWVEPARQWQPVPVRAGDKPGEYRFEPGGHVPVERLRVSLPEPNTVVPLQVLARNAEDRPWQMVASAVLYRLTHGGREVVNTDLALGGDGGSQWLLRMDPRGGGIGSGMPGVEVGWVPRQLVFAARGGPPFALAFGNVQAGPADLPIQTLVPGWRSDAEVAVAPATAGPRQTLAGPRALRPAPDYKTWTLWASLAFGVVLLAWMAWMLARELKGSAPKQ